MSNSPLSELELMAMGARQTGIVYYQKKNEVAEELLSKVVLALAEFMNSPPDKMDEKMSNINDLISEVDSVGSLLGVNFEAVRHENGTGNEEEEKGAPFAV